MYKTNNNISSTKLNVRVYFICVMFTNMNLILDLREITNVYITYCM